MDPQNKSFQINEENCVVVSERGGRIVKLMLGGIIVIEGKHPFDDLGSGNYLMYPWVNRIEKQNQLFPPVFFDGKHLPLHGICVNLLCDVAANGHHNTQIITITPHQIPQNLPSYTLTYVLQPDKLTIKFNMTPPTSIPIIPYCFGFHPFLQINQNSISDLTLQSNISTNLKLDENLLPIYPFVKSQILLDSSHQYDSLFWKEKGAYLRLKGKEGGIEIRSDDMEYWQIYTPPDGKRIAVEPMSFSGNLYSIYDEKQFGKLRLQSSFSITKI